MVDRRGVQPAVCRSGVPDQPWPSHPRAGVLTAPPCTRGAWRRPAGEPRLRVVGPGDSEDNLKGPCGPGATWPAAPTRKGRGNAYGTHLEVRRRLRPRRRPHGRYVGARMFPLTVRPPKRPGRFGGPSQSGHGPGHLLAHAWIFSTRSSPRRSRRSWWMALRRRRNQPLRRLRSRGRRG